LKKAETDQKYEETDLKFEETDQQIEIYKVFEKSGNGPKNKRKLIKKKRKPFNSKYWETDTNIWKSLNNSELLRDFLEFLKKTEMPQK